MIPGRRWASLEYPVRLACFLFTTTHPAYQRIIGLGPQVIPLILSDLKRELGHRFWALSALTGENPVDPADRGRVSAMAAAWLKWGTDNGWIA